MKRDLAGVSKRLVAGVLVAVAVVGVSALAIHARGTGLASTPPAVKNPRLSRAAVDFDGMRAFVSSH